jgi:hypothetical protein
MVVKTGKFPKVAPDVTGEPEVRKKGSLEYPRGLKKIASYGAVVREMDCDRGCGKYKKILNVYVYPNDILDVQYADAPVIDGIHGENSISKQNVRKHGEKDKAIWSKHDSEVEGIAARHKKPSKPVHRQPKRSKKTSKHNK